MLDEAVLRRVLAEALKDSDPAVREAAREALGRRKLSP